MCICMCIHVFICVSSSVFMCSLKTKTKRLITSRNVRRMEAYHAVEHTLDGAYHVTEHTSSDGV